MTERLDQIERILSANAQQWAATQATVDANAQQIAINAEAVSLLVSDNRAAREREDAARAEYRRLNDEQSQRIQNLIDDARIDRQATTQRFEAVQAEANRRFDAQMQIAQAMLSELARLNSRVEYLEQRAS